MSGEEDVFEGQRDDVTSGYQPHSLDVEENNEDDEGAKLEKDPKIVRKYFHAQRGWVMKDI